MYRWPWAAGPSGVVRIPIGLVLSTSTGLGLTAHRVHARSSLLGGGGGGHTQEKGRFCIESPMTVNTPASAADTETERDCGQLPRFPHWVVRPPVRTWGPGVGGGSGCHLSGTNSSRVRHSLPSTKAGKMGIYIQVLTENSF